MSFLLFSVPFCFILPSHAADFGSSSVYVFLASSTSFSLFYTRVQWCHPVLLTISVYQFIKHLWFRVCVCLSIQDRNFGYIYNNNCLSVCLYCFVFFPSVLMVIIIYFISIFVFVELNIV